jgi:hypothetical protein
MAESYLALLREERLEALSVAATASGRPVYLLEKDIWVVWALDGLFASPLGEHLVFKGGTSLSKGYDIIKRFSEDIDLTYDVRQLIPDLAKGDPPIPATNSQADKWTKAVREKLVVWVRGDAFLHTAQLASDDRQRARHGRQPSDEAARKNPRLSSPVSRSPTVSWSDRRMEKRPILIESGVRNSFAD